MARCTEICQQCAQKYLAGLPAKKLTIINKMPAFMKSSQASQVEPQKRIAFLTRTPIFKLGRQSA